MNLITKGLVASFFLSTAAVAAGEDAWMQLDNEIASLSSNVTAQSSGSLSAILVNYFNHSSETDTAGWAFESVRLNYKASFEDFSIKASTELKSGTAALRDAYAAWSATDDVTVTWGRFKRPFSYHNQLSVGKLAFSRFTINAKNEDRDIGVKLTGAAKEGAVDWALAAQNGLDGVTEELRYTARVAVAVAGDGAFHGHEGALPGREELDASVGIAYAHDQSETMGFHKVGIEGAATFGGFYLAADIVDYNADDPGTVLDDTLGHDLDESTPYSLTGTYLLKEDVELTARFEDFDDGLDSDRVTFGVNFYQVLPHRAKWILNYEDTSSDDPANEDEVLRFGLTINS